MTATPNLAAVERGFRFAPVRVDLTADAVARYLTAVGADSTCYAGGPALQVAPPLAAVAFALREVQRQVALPAGTIHTGQEVHMYRGLPVGCVLSCETVVSQRSVRGNWIVLKIDIEATIVGDPAPALTACATLMFPQETAT